MSAVVVAVVAPEVIVRVDIVVVMLERVERARRVVRLASLLLLSVVDLVAVAVLLRPASRLRLPNALLRSGNGRHISRRQGVEVSRVSRWKDKHLVSVKADLKKPAHPLFQRCCK